MVMKSTDAISGSFGKVYHEGVHWLNVFGFELNLDINYEDVKRSGTRAKGKKAIDYEVTGTLKSYVVTNDIVKKVSQITDDTKGAFLTELIGTIEDPENPAISGEKVRVKNVQFTSLSVMNFEHGALSERELQFVAEGYEFIDMN